MKPSSFMAVVTADQVSSRRQHDRVPVALDVLAALAPRLVLPFERTVGDEIQGLIADPAAVVEAVTVLTRSGGWRIGVGLGTVEHPLPSSTREARGSAYLAAREAITAARRSPTALAVVAASDIVGADPYREDLGRHAESALVLLRWLLQRRTKEGWAVIDLVESGLTGQDAAARLGITPSAVSQRLNRAARTEAARGVELATALLGQALGVRP